MCRWLAYRGAPVLLEDLIIKPKDNLIHQSLHARAPRTPTNGDGFGLGWYDKHPVPGLFKSIRPAWNDMNLLDLAAHIESPLFMAHVRATSMATVQETNCHPYRYKNWLFVHNGQIADFGKFRQKLLARVKPEYFTNILGSTDSETMFHLALSFGLENDVPGAVAEMVRCVESVGTEVGVEKCIWMTLGISDGKDLWCFRYGSDSKGPTLYVSPDVSELKKLNPEVGQLGDDAVCVVSEPMGEYQHKWTEIPENSELTVNEEGVKIMEFNPWVNQLVH